MQKRNKRLTTILACMLLCAAGCQRETAIFTSEVAGNLQETEERQSTEMKSIQEYETQEQLRRYIYVCGAVRQPGVYPITEDMRVFEAIELAGGFADEADVSWVNQAEPVQDGQKLYIYTKEETSQMDQAIQPEGSSLNENTDGRVNINQATKEILMTLPGIGEAKADAVIQYREEHGAFQTIEEIQNVPGIKSAAFQKIQNMITVGP